MKKLAITLLAFCSSTFLIHAQGGSGIEIGLRGAGASNWLFNSNCDAGGTSSYAAAFSYNGGVQVAYNFSEKTAVEVNVLYGTYTQGYSGKFGTNEYLEYQPDYPSVYSVMSQPTANGESYTASNQIKAIEIPVLFRFGGGTGSYVEIGPEYDMISSVSYTATYTGAPSGWPIKNFSGYDVTPAWSNSNITAVLGFGNDFQLGQSGWNIITDLRFYYGFMDLQGNDAHGQYLAQTLPNGQPNQLYSMNYGGTNKPYYGSYIGTHSAGASFNIGVYYYFPISSTSGHGRCKHLPTVKSH